MSDEDLQNLFSQYGELVSAMVVRDRNSISRGFAYVEFARQEYAQIAIENLNQTKFKGRTITVRYAEK